MKIQSTGLQIMARNSTLRTFKIICHLISMIAIRFWKLCTSATLIILLIYWFYGGALTLLILMAAVFGKCIEMTSLREMGPQLKLPIKVTRGSMPQRCNTYFLKISPFKVSEVQNTCKV